MGAVGLGSQRFPGSNREQSGQNVSLKHVRSAKRGLDVSSGERAMPLLSKFGALRAAPGFGASAGIPETSYFHGSRGPGVP